MQKPRPARRSSGKSLGVSLSLLNPPPPPPAMGADGCDDRGLCSAYTLSLCNWQPRVIIACTTGKLHKQGKTQQSIVKNIIPYHGVCWLSDKACVDSLQAASTHCLYSTTDTLLLAGKTKSPPKTLPSWREREGECVFVNVCQQLCVCVCKCCMHTLGCVKSTKTMLAFT